MNKDNKYVRWFQEIKIEDIPVVGGKNANENYSQCTGDGKKTIIMENEKINLLTGRSS
jgi:hypothetical protein